MSIEIPEGYKPSDSEPYMNPRQLEYFRRKLLAWRDDLVRELNDVLVDLKSEHLDIAGDNADRAYVDMEAGVELGAEDRIRDLIYRVDEALDRIEDGSYGYCEDTGNEIGLKRLEAWPVAMFTIEAQRKREWIEKQQRGLV